MMAPAARPTSHHLIRRRTPAKILCMQNTSDVGVIKRMAGTAFFCIKFGQLGAHTLRINLSSSSSDHCTSCI